MSDDVLFVIDEGVAIITFNRPERMNAIDAGMAATLLDHLTDLRRNDDVRAIVLTGTGKAFCAGAALSGERAQREPSRWERKAPIGVFAMVPKAIVEVDKPVIAAISGPAVGAGFSYTLCCDRRIGDENARVSAIFMKRAIHPDCGITYFLPRVAGLPTALWMIETGVILNAAEAKAAGVLDEVVPAGQALERALAYAKELARGPALTMELARRAVYRSLSASLDEMLVMEGFGASVANNSEDRKEGVAAFLERREPRFSGR